MTDQARNRRTTKLDMTKAREIRRLASVGNVSKDIAKMFDVSYTNINHILKGETWREQYAS